MLMKNISSMTPQALSEMHLMEYNNFSVNLTYQHDPPQNEINICDSTKSRFHEFEFWMNGVLTNIIVVLGLIGNILTLFILSQRVMRSSTNYYLMALAVWDSIVLIFTALLIGLPEIRHTYRTMYHAYVVSYLYPIALIAQTATIWITVSFTVERYIAVCHPLKAASMCTISSAKWVILGVSIGSTLFNIPRWFDFRPDKCWSPEYGAYFVIRKETAFNEHPTYRKIYFSGLYVLVMCFIPLTVLFLMNLFLIRAVRRSRKQRQTMHVRQSRENNVTIMLISVVIVFIICQVPALIYNIAYAIFGLNFQSSIYMINILSILRNFLVNFNSAINFLLYCAIGQKFRSIFLHTVCWRCKSQSSYFTMYGAQRASFNNANTVYNYKSRAFERRSETDIGCGDGKKPVKKMSSPNSVQSHISMETAFLAAPGELNHEKANKDSLNSNNMNTNQHLTNNNGITSKFIPKYSRPTSSLPMHLIPSEVEQRSNMANRNKFFRSTDFHSTMSENSGIARNGVKDKLLDRY